MTCDRVSGTRSYASNVVAAIWHTFSGEIELHRFDSFLLGLDMSFSYFLSLTGVDQCRYLWYRGQLGCHVGTHGVNPLWAGGATTGVASADLCSLCSCVSGQRSVRYVPGWRAV